LIPFNLPSFIDSTDWQLRYAIVFGRMIGSSKSRDSCVDNQIALFYT